MNDSTCLVAVNGSRAGARPRGSRTIIRWKSLGGGVYRDSITGHFYERPTIAGKRTFRKLVGHNLKLARESMAQRRTAQAKAELGIGKDPYAKATIPTVGTLLDKYNEAGCPDRKHRPRAGIQLSQIAARIRLLREFFADHRPGNLHPIDDSEAYFRFRSKQRLRKVHGGRAADLDLQVLASAIQWGVSKRIVETNPMATGRPTFATGSVVSCRESAPLTSEELHWIAASFFESPKSEVLGWQVLLEGFTGCRTSEVVALRWDAKPREPGFIDGQYLWLKRSKGGVNPFALIHPALGQLLSALKAWREHRHPLSPWFLPSPMKIGGPITTAALAHSLRLARTKIGRRITSHGMRSFYVTARRSQGISDGQIAAEIGDKTGAAIIASTYGSIPPNWQGLEKIEWIPKTGPAWDTLSK